MESVTIQIQDIFSPIKAAEFLGVSRMTLWRWVKDGKIIPLMIDHNYFHINELNRVKEGIKVTKKATESDRTPVA